jgi:hypothetical protein
VTGEVVNLRRARKAKTRAASATQAAGNRVRFGRTLNERVQADAAATAAVRHLDGHRLSPEQGPVRPPADDSPT